METLTLDLTGMAQGGEAFGRHEGKIIFVPYAIMGEQVRVEIVESHKNYARARVVEILRPSPARVTPRCPHFGPRPATVSANPRAGWARGCGGCQWQHLAYPSQLEHKTQIVRDQFARIGKLPDAPVAPTLGMGEPWSYRNHAQFAVNDAGELCFRAYESHDLVPIHECYLLEPSLVSMFHAIIVQDIPDSEQESGGPEGEAQEREPGETEREISENAREQFESNEEDEPAGGAWADEVSLRAGIRTGERMMVIESHNPEPPALEIDEPVSVAFHTQGVTIPLIGNTRLHEVLAGRTFEYSPMSFFQVNTTMAEVLVDLVRRYLEPQPGDTLLDAYAGAGVLGLTLAPEVQAVILVEEYGPALEDARTNAAGASGVEFLAGRVEDVLPNLARAFQLAVLDPPRAGCEPAALQALLQAQPRRIAYVSCDPATLARDARRLVEGGYRLTHVQPVDLFPQTYHIECVARFERAASLA